MPRQPKCNALGLVVHRHLHTALSEINPQQVLMYAQVGPLYFETVPKGGRFRRKTGAVWFTVKAAVQTNPDDKITTWDAVWPVATVTVGILAAAATGGVPPAQSDL